MNLYLTLLIAVALVVFLPKFGALALYKEHSKRKLKETIEDALKYLIERQYQGNMPSRDSLGGKLRLNQAQTAELVENMESQGLVGSKGMNLMLTPDGEKLGIRIIRAHRLWEKFLADEAKMPLDKIHKEAHRLEHTTTKEQLDQMEADMGYPTHDPHGDPIPSLGGKIVEIEKASITEWEVGLTARIIEIEDEPQMAYQQLAATGIRLGMNVRVLEHTKDRIILSDGETMYKLAPVIASNIQVTKITESELKVQELPNLLNLKPKQKAEIVSLDDTVQGFTRRRFLDLGMTPGATIYPELENFFGEPRAYRIRGTLIALRSDQAKQIKVKVQE